MRCNVRGFSATACSARWLALAATLQLHSGYMLVRFCNFFSHFYQKPKHFKGNKTTHCALAFFYNFRYGMLTLPYVRSAVFFAVLLEHTDIQLVLLLFNDINNKWNCVATAAGLAGRSSLSPTSSVADLSLPGRTAMQQWPNSQFPFRHSY